MATTITEGTAAPSPRTTTEPPKGDVHVYGHLKDGKGQIICATEEAGQARNRDVRRNEIVVGLGNMIPLWAPNVTLYWRFNPRSFNDFPDAKAKVRSMMGTALDDWRDSRPVNFAERDQGWDFEVVLRNAADCDARGCVLASSFFPDQGRHKFYLYPTMFEQDEDEQIETLIHEFGHVFGLRHFFAPLLETDLRSEIFGTHVKFSIMNYGEDSKLTDADRDDLKTLYKQARSGELRAINGTPIHLMRPFSAIGT
jgi:hypothetical protein